MKNKFVTVARFNQPLEAEMAKGRLEAEGIECYLADNNAINIQPLYTNAIGGVRLQVPTEKEAQAREALRRSLSLVPPQKTCPRCESTDVTASKIVPIANFLSFITLGALMAPSRRPRQCRSCGHRWRA